MLFSTSTYVRELELPTLSQLIQHDRYYYSNGQNLLLKLLQLWNNYKVRQLSSQNPEAAELPAQRGHEFGSNYATPHPTPREFASAGATSTLL